MTTRAALSVAPSSETTRFTNAPTFASSSVGAVAIRIRLSLGADHRARRGAASPQGTPLVLPTRELARKLLAGVDSELAIRVAQVVLDGLGAEEQLRRRLARGVPAREHERDLELLRRQVVERAGVAPPRALAGRQQLRVCALAPRRGAERLEGLGGGAELLAGLHPVSRAAQALTEAQARARRLEAIGRGGVELEGVGEERAECVRAGEQGPGTGESRQRPRLPLATGRDGEPAERVLDVRFPSCPHRNLDLLGNRRDVGVGDTELGEHPALLVEPRRGLFD